MPVGLNDHHHARLLAEGSPDPNDLQLAFAGDAGGDGHALDLTTDGFVSGPVVQTDTAVHAPARSGWNPRAADVAASLPEYETSVVSIRALEGDIVFDKPSARG